MSGQSLLPPGFEELTQFIDKWGKSSFAERMDERHRSEMGEITEFYEAASARIDDMFAALRTSSISTLPPKEQRLYNLLMSLGHVAHSVERHGSAMPAGTNYPYALKITEGLSPA